jgi:aerobic carbon-monoxide dehydrogenase medium subunit
MNRFDYYEPKTVEETCRLLSELTGEVRIVAGGTDLVPKMKTGLIKPRALVNIKKIPKLDLLNADSETGISIGALALISDIATHPIVLERFPAVAAAARSIGSLQVRNLATVGGNLCNAAPSADMAPALLVMDATVKIAGLSGNRTMLLEEFFLGPGKVSLGRGEWLTGVRIPFPPSRTRQTYLKHSIRRAMDIAIVGVAVALSFEEEGGVCRKARIALGAVAPTPVRAERAEALILGKKLADISVDAIGEEVSHEAAPITDVRGSAGYRSEMISTLTVKAIRALQDEWSTV